MLSGTQPTATIKRNGAGRETRTPDPLITNQMLYQLSYTGNKSVAIIHYDFVQERILTKIQEF